MISRFISVSLACAALALPIIGCTANVDDPKVDQGGQDNDADVCRTECNDTQTTCVGSCNDDGCKATCKTDYDDCVSDCD